MKKIQGIQRKSISNSLKKAVKELNVYKEIYKLDTITISKHVSKEFFQYCQNKEMFLLLIMYNNEGKVYLKQCGENAFCLPGGQVDENNAIVDSVNRLTANFIHADVVSDVEPLVLVENTFIFEEQNVKHTGLVMMARVNTDEERNFVNGFYEINNTILNSINIFSNRTILQLYLERFSDIVKRNNGEFQNKEIETNKKYKMRYKLHNELVKRFLLTPRMKKLNKLKDIMAKKCRHCRNLIDVSCGDNSLLFSLLSNKEIEYVIANDISWSQIEMIEPKDKVIFTNHNAITFPFKDNAFDFVYCSNTLHHISDSVNLKNLLESLIRVGKKVVIYEIEDPKITRGIPYLLNKYWYRGFLKDVGEQYLSFEEFKEIINNAYKGKATIKFENFKNIQGNYMIAEIEKNTL